MFEWITDRFKRTPILGSSARKPELSLGQLRERAADARLLLESDAYTRAYQRALDRLVDKLLEVDVTKPEDRDRAIYLIARAQQQAEIVVELRSELTDYEVARAREEKRQRAA